MRTAGVIAEFDPFHNGHAWLIEQLRDPHGGNATHIVVVMSGNYVQRGGPALLPKEDRVKMALSGGADLVVELPVPYVLSSAEGFADGAVALLDALGCVDVLGFGSECGDTRALWETACRLDEPETAARMRFHLEAGISYAEARQRALRERAGRQADLLDGANNTLGIEYIRAIRRRQSSIQPLAFRRFGAGHEDVCPGGTTASAGCLRAMVAEGRLRSAAPYMPPAAFALLSEAVSAGRAPADPALAERALLYRLRSMSREELALLPGISEGLEYRLYKAVRASGSVEELIGRVKTRRYPAARIRRTLWAAYAGVQAADRADTPPYVRVLGLTGRGEEILSAAAAAGTARSRGIALFSRAAATDTLSPAGKVMFSRECAADDRYDLTLPHPRACGTSCTAGVVRA